MGYGAICSGHALGPVFKRGSGRLSGVSLEIAEGNVREVTAYENVIQE